MTDTGAGRPRRVAVIVVHGVGDNQPGSTVNYVVDSLRDQSADKEAAEQIKPNRYNEAYSLPEPTTSSWLTPVGYTGDKSEREAGRRRIDRFPVVGRTAQLAASGSTAGFYELHWADLARAGNGWIDTVVSFARFIFEIPHVVDGLLRETNGLVSKLLRWTLLLLTCFVRGPLAGYCVVMLFGGLVFLSFSQIPDQEEVKNLLTSVVGWKFAKAAELSNMPINPLFRGLLAAMLGSAIIGALTTIVVATRYARWAIVAGAAWVMCVASFYLFDAFWLRPARYPDYAGMVYIDYLSVMLFGLAVAGLYIFITRRSKEVGFADLGASAAIWAVVIITHLSPLMGPIGQWLENNISKYYDISGWLQHFADIEAGVRATSSSIHFRAFEIYYPLLKWLWAIWAILMAIAIILALCLFVANRRQWNHGYRGVFAALSLAVLQSCVWLSVLPAFGILHMDDVLCRGNPYAEYSGGSNNPQPPVTCQTRLRQNYEVLSILRQIRAAEENREIGLVSELKTQLTETLRSREPLTLNSKMLVAMEELSLSFLWHGFILGTAIFLTLLVVVARYIARLTGDRIRQPRLIISNVVIGALCIFGVINIALCLGWVEGNLPRWLHLGDPLREAYKALTGIELPKVTGLRVPAEAVQMAGMAGTAVLLLSQLPFIATRLGGVLQIMRALIDHHYRSNVCISPWFAIRNTNLPTRRHHITHRLHTLVTTLVTGTATARVEPFDDVVFLSHSQGSVIVYDYLASDVAKTALGNIRPHVLTVGSPLQSIYSYYFNEYSSVEQRIGRLAVVPKSWTNLYRPDDPIAGPINPGRVAIGDIEVTDERMPDGGHLKYWEEPLVIKRILELLIERAHGQPIQPPSVQVPASVA